MNNLITLKDLQQRMAAGVPLGTIDENTVRRLWWGALDTLQNQILLPMNLSKGIWLSSPLPALYEPKLLKSLQGWVWAPEALENFQNSSTGLLLPSCSLSLNQTGDIHKSNFNRLKLFEEDGNDPLLIIISQEIQIALALQGKPGERNLLMRSDPDTLSELLSMLDARLNRENPEEANKLRKALEDLGHLRSNEGFSNLFWPLLAQKLAGMGPTLNIQTLPKQSTQNESENKSNVEISLLEAITHEVRTPLATIRTLIRSLLRRKDISSVVEERLSQIDAECTEQIDRFSLIFNAVELERKRTETEILAITDLGHILELLSPAWSNQLERKGLKLKLDITPELPKVLSDPEGLELMLGGLIDRNTRSLQPGGVVTLKLRPAGQRLKLQIISTIPKGNNIEMASNADVGPVLSWNPITGSLQLSQSATKRLLKSLGGKLTNQRNNGITIFFPISESKNITF